MENGNGSRTVISIVFSFILFVALTGLIFCSLLSATAFNASYLERSLDRSQYVDRSYNNLRSILEEEAVSRELPQDILTGLLDEEQYKQNLEANINAALQGQKAVTYDDTAKAWEEAARQEITDYLSENQVGKNQWIQMTVDELAGISVNYYENYSTFPFGEYFFEYKNDYSTLIKIMIPIFLIIAAVLAIMLLKLQIRFFKGWYYILSSFLAAAIVSIVGGIVMNVKADFTFPDTLAGYNAFIDQFFGEAISMLWMCGIVIIILAIIGFIFLRKHEEKNDIE